MHTDGSGRFFHISMTLYSVQTQIIIICEAKIPVYTAMYRVRWRGYYLYGVFL